MLENTAPAETTVEKKKPTFIFTLLSLRIGRIFVKNPHSRQWNYAIARDVEAKPNVTHDVLKKFQDFGWVTAAREPPNPALGRAERTLYSITEAGARTFTDVLGSLQMAST